MVSVTNIFDGSIKNVEKSDLTWRVSVYGVLKEKNSMLLSRNPGFKNNAWCIPGGEIEKGEIISEAISREFKEETGLTVIIKRLLHVKEGFISFDGITSYQSLGIFYEVEKFEGELNTNLNEEDSAEAKFIDINDLKTKDLVQDFFKEIIDLT